MHMAWLARSRQLVVLASLIAVSAAAAGGVTGTPRQHLAVDLPHELEKHTAPKIGVDAEGHSSSHERDQAHATFVRREHAVQPKMSVDAQGVVTPYIEQEQESEGDAVESLHADESNARLQETTPAADLAASLHEDILEEADDRLSDQEDTAGWRRRRRARRRYVAPRRRAAARPGARGLPGARGPPGPRGSAVRGPPGHRGATGARGSNGGGGPRGAPGPKGTTGARGPTGAKGVAGTSGKNGVGVGGKPGTPGAKGQQGKQGVQGIPGKPAPIHPKIDCSWQTWMEWEPCSQSCAGGGGDSKDKKAKVKYTKAGKRRRERTVKIYPQDGGKTCTGTGIEIQECGKKACPTTTTSTTTTNKNITKAGAISQHIGASALLLVFLGMTTPSCFQ